MADISIVRHRINYLTPSIDAYLLKEQSLGFFAEEKGHTRTKTTTKWVAIWDQFLIQKFVLLQDDMQTRNNKIRKITSQLAKLGS